MPPRPVGAATARGDARDNGPPLAALDLAAQACMLLRGLSREELAAMAAMVDPPAPEAMLRQKREEVDEAAKFPLDDSLDSAATGTRRWESGEQAHPA